jgi:hypothetical protein
MNHDLCMERLADKVGWSVIRWGNDECDANHVPLQFLSRVARWHIFKPKIPIWVNFGGSCNGRCWFIFWPFGLFYNYRVYFVAIFGIMYGHLVYFCHFGIMYIWSFGIFLPFWYVLSRKIWHPCY